MHNVRWYALAGLLTLLLAGCQVTHKMVDGDFVGLPVQAHSLSRAKLDVYMGFECRPCQKAPTMVSALQKRFGQRLKVEKHYFLLPGRPDQPMRLYLVAKKARQADKVASLLMQSQLDPSKPGEVAVLTHWVAKQTGLLKDYQASLSDPAMDKALKDVVSRTHQQLQYKPALVLNGRMMFGDDMANAEHIISQALTVNRGEPIHAVKATSHTAGCSVARGDDVPAQPCTRPGVGGTQ